MIVLFGRIRVFEHGFEHTDTGIGPYHIIVSNGRVKREGSIAPTVTNNMMKMLCVDCHCQLKGKMIAFRPPGNDTPFEETGSWIRPTTLFEMAHALVDIAITEQNLRESALSESVSSPISFPQRSLGT